MEQFKLGTISAESLKLFAEVKDTFAASEYEKIRRLIKELPTTFVDEGKKINIVFAGQYSAGKSSLLSILTGEKLAIGEGVTTGECQTLEWNNLHIIDTPGIHTQNRPDHDEITYKAIAQADLLVFVITGEGFSQHLAAHFKQLIGERGKGREMMLVVNKMESTGGGNTQEQQQVILEHDILPVIESEGYTAEDFYISFVDANSYFEAQEESDPETKNWLLENSGIEKFINNLNRFVNDKQLFGQCTTSLYKLEQQLLEAQCQFNSNDFNVDGSKQLLTQNRSYLQQAKSDIIDKSYNIIRKYSSTVISWGSDIADTINEENDVEDVNKNIEEKNEATKTLIDKAAQEFDAYAKESMAKLEENVTALATGEFAQCLKESLEKENSVSWGRKWGNAGQKVGKVLENIGDTISNLTKGSKAAGMSGSAAFFKNAAYSGSKAHNIVLKVGHAFGKKFKPYEALKITKGIGQGAKIMGIAGGVVSLGAQIGSDIKEAKVTKELQQMRNQVLRQFSDNAKILETTFDNETKTWVVENIDNHIDIIDRQLNDLSVAQQNHSAECDCYNDYLRRVRELISAVADCML